MASGTINRDELGSICVTANSKREKLGDLLIYVYQMIISLSGKAGAGRTTVAEIICEKLGYEHISVGNIKKKKAQEMGITILEFNKIGDLPENVEAYDLSYEKYQQDLNLNSKILLDSKLCAYNQPKSFRIRFLVSDEIAATRLIHDTKRFGDIV
jgi:CMP/dCMP kinase